jgi:hypothetical protein
VRKIRISQETIERMINAIDLQAIKEVLLQEFPPNLRTNPEVLAWVDTCAELSLDDAIETLIEAKPEK